MTRATRLAAVAIVALLWAAAACAAVAAGARDHARTGRAVPIAPAVPIARAAHATHSVHGRQAHRAPARSPARCRASAHRANARRAHRAVAHRPAGVGHGDRPPTCVAAGRPPKNKHRPGYSSAPAGSGTDGALPAGALDEEDGLSASGSQAGPEGGSQGFGVEPEGGTEGAGAGPEAGSEESEAGSEQGVGGGSGAGAGGGSTPGAPGAGSGASEGSSGSPSEGSGGSPTEGAESPPVETVETVETSETSEPAIAPPPTPFRFFAASSFWNAALPAEAPLDPTSSAVVGALHQEVTKELAANVGPWINTTKYSVPIYTVPANQATVAVQLVNHAPEPALSAAWSAVPLPAGALPAKGTDGTLALWQPSTDRLWEFHRLVHETGGWCASWGGAIQNVSSSQGVYGKSSWTGAEPWWGASASSLSLVGGLITLEDLQLGQINHALDLAVPAVRSSVYSLPAQRTDGKSLDPLALPEGAHLRLNPNLDLASLHLPPLTLMLARAAQRYGIMVSDYSSVVELYAQDPTPTGTEPYKGTGGYFEGKYPNQLLASFPWSQLELLKMELHKSS